MDQTGDRVGGMKAKLHMKYLNSAIIKFLQALYVPSSQFPVHRNSEPNACVLLYQKLFLGPYKTLPLLPLMNKIDILWIFKS